MDYYRGNFFEEAARNKGWLLGHFMEQGDVRHTDRMEIKFWKFAKGEDPCHLPKHQKTALECTLILKGKITGSIDGKDVVLEAGDYVLIPATVPSNFPRNVLEDVEGLTIKAPSVQGDTVKTA